MILDRRARGEPLEKRQKKPQEKSHRDYQNVSLKLNKRPSSNTLICDSNNEIIDLGKFEDEEGISDITGTVHENLHKMQKAFIQQAKQASSHNILVEPAATTQPSGLSFFHVVDPNRKITYSMIGHSGSIHRPNESKPSIDLTEQAPKSPVHGILHKKSETPRNSSYISNSSHRNSTEVPSFYKNMDITSTTKEPYQKSQPMFKHSLNESTLVQPKRTYCVNKNQLTQQSLCKPSNVYESRDFPDTKEPSVFQCETGPCCQRCCHSSAQSSVFRDSVQPNAFEDSVRPSALQDPRQSVYKEPVRATTTHDISATCKIKIQQRGSIRPLETPEPPEIIIQSEQTPVVEQSRDDSFKENLRRPVPVRHPQPVHVSLAPKVATIVPENHSTEVKKDLERPKGVPPENLDQGYKVTLEEILIPDSQERISIQLPPMHIRSEESLTESQTLPSKLVQTASNKGTQILEEPLPKPLPVTSKLSRRALSTLADLERKESWAKNIKRNIIDKCEADIKKSQVHFDVDILDTANDKTIVLRRSIQSQSEDVSELPPLKNGSENILK